MCREMNLWRRERTGRGSLPCRARNASKGAGPRARREGRGGAARHEGIQTPATGLGCRKRSQVGGNESDLLFQGFWCLLSFSLPFYSLLSSLCCSFPFPFPFPCPFALLALPFPSLPFPSLLVSSLLFSFLFFSLLPSSFFPFSILFARDCS